MALKVGCMALLLACVAGCGEEKPVVIPIGEELQTFCRSEQEDLVCYRTFIGAPPSRIEVCNPQFLERGDVITWNDDCREVTDFVKYLIDDIAFEMIIPAGYYNVPTGDGYYYTTAKLYL